MRRKITQQPPRLGATSRSDRRRVKQTEPFYKTKQWEDCIERIKHKRGKRCEKCGRNGVMTRLYGDHIVEIRDGGELFDESNIQLLCGSCHTKKTLQVRMERSR